MIIGIPREVKTHEYRVGIVPASLQVLITQGHRILVEHSAGLGAGFTDEDYIACGAQIVSDVYANAELIVKVKEPQPAEIKKLSAQQIVFSFLHLAANKKLAEDLMRSGVTAFAYETVTDTAGGLPILKPMSEIAGRIVVQEGAHHLEKPQGGLGILLGGVSGVESAKVVVVGAGVVGSNAVAAAVAMGARVTVLDVAQSKLDSLMASFKNISAYLSNEELIAKEVADADLVIGAVLVPAAHAPKVITADTVRCMQPGAVIADVAIDQGGCIETSRPTDFSKPTYVQYGVIHQCITNLPGSVPRTSTFALNNVTMPYILELANKGYKQACLENSHLLAGLNICQKAVCHPVVAKAIEQTYVEPLKLLQT